MHVIRNEKVPRGYPRGPRCRFCGAIGPCQIGRRTEYETGDEWLVSGEGRGAGELAMCGGMVQRHHGAGEGLEVSYGLGVSQLAALEVAGLKVNHAGHQVGPEPGQHRAKLGVDAEVVMVGGAHTDEPAGLAVQSLDRDMVKKVLERASVGGAEDGVAMRHMSAAITRSTTACVSSS